ncbi:MAG: DotA/TraY family protein [Gallionella sp.]|nr:DotA/TraY family protein [Gallionella sp.]
MRLILLILLTALTLPTWADAGNSGGTGLHLYTPPVGDISVDFLRQIFGAGKDGIGLGGEGTVLGAAMAIFNQAVLFLAMIFVFFTTVKGTVDSAHDGAILGKKMSEVWVPIRTIGGAAFLLPLPSGFSLIQICVLWLALHGVGAADAAWQAAMSRFAETGTLGRASIPAARPLAANILRAEVCMAAMNKQFEDSNRAERIEAVATPARVQLVHAYYATVDYRWQSTMRSVDSPASCGALEWQESTQHELTKDMTHAARGAIWAAHKNAVEALILSLRPVAQQIVSGKRPPAGIVDAAANAYENIIASAAKDAVDASPDIAQQSFIKHAETGGWILTGTWFTHMVKLNDTIQATVNMAPAFKPMAIENLEVNEVLQNYRDALSFTDSYLQDRSAAARDSYQAELENSSSIRTAQDVLRLLSIPAMSAMEGITARIAGANTSPLTQLSAIGHDIISAGVVIKASLFTIAGFSGARISSWTVGNVFNVSEALKTISGTIEFLSSSLWALGAVLAYYLPAIPSIWWIVGCIRWLANVAMALMAAPLMAAMMASSSGDDVTGRSTAGWMIILSMVIQPVLLVIGFILAAAMTYPAGLLVNMMFLGMVSGASAGSAVGLVSMVAWCCAYVAMMILAIHTCFGLISAVDGVMHYVGSQAGAPGIGQQQADKAISGLEGGAAGAGAAATPPKAPGGVDSKPTPGGEKNGFTNADHLAGH